MTTQQVQRTRKNKKRVLHATGRLIKQLRKASGYTQEEIKNILGFQATSAISKIESRDFIPDLLRLQKLLTLLNPNQEQKRKILDYYGYQEGDLPEKHEFVSSLKGKAEKGDILSALHTLFYLFVYDKDYTGVIETVQSLYQKQFYIPQAVRSCQRELEMILREIFSCRRMLAQGMLAQQQMPLEEALQRAEMANQLLTLIHERYKKKLNEDAHLFLDLIRLHISFCAENTYFGMLSLDPEAQSEMFEPQKLEVRENDSLPKIREVIEEIESKFPEYNLQDARQMTLYVERETLHLLFEQCRQNDRNLLANSLKELKVEVEGEILATHWLQALEKNSNDAVFQSLYQNTYKSDQSQKKSWQPTLKRFREILKAHQKVVNWDGSTAQTAIVSTFLNYPLLLARLGNFTWAQDIMDLLYLQLTVSETHYRWANNLALCKGMEYIHSLQFSTKKLKEDQLKIATDCLTEITELLEKVVADVKHIKKLNSPQSLRYTFLEEPVFYLTLLHASKHPQLKSHAGVKSLMAQLKEQVKLEA